MTQVYVTTAVALTDKQRQAIVKGLTAKYDKVEVVEQVDPAIVGGIRIRVGSREFDNSIKAKLDQVRDSLLSQI